MRPLPLVLLACMSVMAVACSSSERTTNAPATSASTVAPVPVPNGTAVAEVEAAPGHTISAFGASGAWWPNDVAHFPRATQRRVANMLFSDRGIALSAYR